MLHIMIFCFNTFANPTAECIIFEDIPSREECVRVAGEVNLAIRMRFPTQINRSAAGCVQTEVRESDT